MKVLVACEFSQIVTEAFTKRGHYAMSCDLLPAEKNYPHYQGDIQDVLSNHGDEFDLMIAFPPCTYLSYVGIRHWNKPGRAEKRLAAFEFFMKCVNTPIKKICIENPVGFPNVAYRKPDQIIHPYYFGEPYQKRTCLWLKNLPKLEYLETIIEKPKPLYFLKTTGKAINWVEGLKGVPNRSQARSISFKGIAEAMAGQWG